LYAKDHPEAKKHFDLHGDTVFDLSFMVEESERAPEVIEGVGQMKHTLVGRRSFPRFPTARGIEKFDHNTINLEMGKLSQTVCDYMAKFVLEKGQYFDIHTNQTGLKSWVTRAPNFGVQIPFNEPSDRKSQIQEYIDIHRGPGVQHIALLSKNIIQTMDSVMGDERNNFKFLDIPDTYYELAPKRVQIRESFSDLSRLRILVDQDKVGGYLLQIFTQNLFGGFFFELIQREGNIGFGEGNFQALFESIELDQKRRGVL
jgi:4-hydroxyphenylpyruvate dioxygenase